MQQSHGLFAIAKLLVNFALCTINKLIYQLSVLLCGQVWCSGHHFTVVVVFAAAAVMLAAGG